MSEVSDFRRVWQQQATERDASLCSARGELSLIARKRVSDRDMTIDGIPGTWSVKDGLRGVELKASAEDGIRVDGELVTDQARIHWLAADGPTIAVLPRGSECVVSSEDGSVFTLQVWDRHSACAENVVHIERYDYDPAWIVPAQIKEPPPGRTVRQRRAQSEEEVEVPVVAEVILTIADRYYLLQATQSGDNLVMRFTDNTTGTDTPSDGRVVTLNLSGAAGAAIGGVALLDLNRVELLSSSVNSVWDSLTAAEGNYLPLAVTAGEKRGVPVPVGEAKWEFRPDTHAVVTSSAHDGLD